MKSPYPTAAANPTPVSPSVQLTCSICGQRFYLDETDAPPFCSSRCKMIDLNRWFNEEVSLPHEGGPTKGEAVDDAEPVDPDAQP